jgi:hypothetical protein
LYHLKVNPLQTALDFELLNELIIKIKIGAYKNVKIKAKNNL